MLETKYGLRYPMPHVLVHIVDNSASPVESNVTIADDPSMYGTIVVTGSPMGEDRRVLNITRSDILNVAFGLGSLSTDDIVKYGQTVTYPSSLIEQGAPVKLLRVTPDDACYAYACIAIEWRWNTTDQKMEVRFNTGKLADERSLSNFANRDRLNAAIVKSVKGEIAADEGDPCQVSWKRRAFITGISAGRGSVYNNFSLSINQVTQGKRPTNVQYSFITTDLSKNATVEQFYASLVNVGDARYNTNTYERIESANVVVTKRAEGSSIIVPYVNESAVRELYNEYHAMFGEMMESDPEAVTDYIREAYARITVNTFDPIFGNYIWNGTDDTIKMPYFKVDMRSNDVPMLPMSNRVYTTDAETIVNAPQLLDEKILPLTVGIGQMQNEPVTLGDVYLYSGTASMNNPYIYVVAQINQYSGAVTTVRTNKIKNGSDQAQLATIIETEGVISTSTTSKTVFENALINKLKNGIVHDGDVVASYATSAGTWVLYLINDGATDHAVNNGTIAINTDYTSIAETVTDVLQNIVLDANSKNIIATDSSSSAYDRKGATRLDQSTGAVSVVGYGGPIHIDADYINMNYGQPPSSVDTVSDMIGTEFDVIKIDNDSLYKLVTGDSAPTFTANTYYQKSGNSYTLLETEPDDWATAYNTYYTKSDITTGVPTDIVRYIVTGSIGSLYRVQQETAVIVPWDYYSDTYGINITSADGGVRLENGYTGFFDDNISEIEFKWRYSLLLTKAYRGQIDPRILSPNRVPAKYLFDGGTNTVIGQTLLPTVTYTVEDLIYASTIFTEDEKDEVMLDPSIITWSADDHDIDVKQAMYDLMIHRVYDGIPEDKRPVGPGSGLSLHLDAGVTNSETSLLINQSFSKRFDNPNASWDVGGYTSSIDGVTYTNTKRLADHLITHCKTETVNKPFTGNYSKILADEYVSYFPDIDTTDWDYRQLIYNSGGNAWIPDVNGNLIRRSQRTLMRGSDTSDLVQESNMRTLSQLVYLLKNKLEEKLFEYNDDSVLKTTSDEVNNMFSNWVGTLVQSLDINFVRDTNPDDGADVIVCYVDVTFRGINLRIPVIVNVNRRTV